MLYDFFFDNPGQVHVDYYFEGLKEVALHAVDLPVETTWQDAVEGYLPIAQSRLADFIRQFKPEYAQYLPKGD